MGGGCGADSGNGAGAVAARVARVSGVQAQHIEHVPEVEADGLDTDQHLSISGQCLETTL